jgi:cyclopropane fatty-acyl-phospholipid synthase-like methyltransferase
MPSSVNYHCVAYAGLDVCNPLDMATVDAALARTGLRPGARALDIGTGNGSIAVRLAETFDLAVTAVELDPAMAAIARARITASAAADRIDLRQTTSGVVLADMAPLDLIVATGTTDPAGNGQLDVLDIFAALSGYLAPGGWLLWGDLVWTAEPPVPVRQIFEWTNRFTTEDGTLEAARAVGLDVVSTDRSPPATMQRFLETIDREVRAWLDAHPDAPEAVGIRTSADRVKMMFDFGRPYIDFSLCLMRKPPI